MLVSKTHLLALTLSTLLATPLVAHADDQSTECTARSSALPSLIPGDSGLLEVDLMGESLVLTFHPDF